MVSSEKIDNFDKYSSNSLEIISFSLIINTLEETSKFSMVLLTSDVLRKVSAWSLLTAARKLTGLYPQPAAQGAV